MFMSPIYKSTDYASSIFEHHFAHNSLGGLIEMSTPFSYDV
jgi:hypothetical protein